MLSGAHVHVSSLQTRHFPQVLREVLSRAKTYYHNITLISSFPNFFECHFSEHPKTTPPPPHPSVLHSPRTCLDVDNDVYTCKNISFRNEINHQLSSSYSHMVSIKIRFAVNGRPWDKHQQVRGTRY